MQRPLSAFMLALRLALLILLALFLGAVSVGAQLVTPKTVPVFQDEQFNITPSSRPGLGSAFITLDDTLGDPFTNPAKVLRLHGVSAAAAPYVHEISGQRGGGSTLPIALFAAGGEWAGAVLVAYQNLDRAGPLWNRPVDDRTASNQYMSGMLARRVGSVSVGAGVSHASLGAIDGVDLLYAGSDRIDQRGSVTEYRIGMLREWVPGHAFELLAIHSRTDMTHEVHFTTWTFSPVVQQWQLTQRLDHNLDQTRIWGLHSRYTRPVGSDGWRVGGILTADRLSHPKIPNYVLQNIPRDPGTTYGYDIGVGAGRIAGRSSVFADLVVEPLTSRTWADLARDTTDAHGVPLPAGTKTTENSFNFHNSKARVGAGYAVPVNADSSSTIGLDIGVAVYTIGYGLRQTNNIAGTTREQAERWAEVSQNVGLRFRSRDFELSYAFRRTCGNRGCGDPAPAVTFPVVLDAPGGIIAAPSAPLFLESGKETSHRFMVAVPVR